MEGRIATRVKAIVEEKRLRWEKEIEETFASALDNRDEDQLVDLRVFAAKNAIITLKIGKMAGYGVYSEYLEDPSAQEVSGEMSGVAEDGQVAGRGRQVDFLCPAVDCTARILFLKNMPRHIRRKHPILCAYCHSNFATARDRKDHVGSVHYKERLSCDKCTFTTTGRTHLVSHVNRDHPEEDE